MLFALHAKRETHRGCGSCAQERDLLVVRVQQTKPSLVLRGHVMEDFVQQRWGAGGRERETDRGDGEIVFRLAHHVNDAHQGILCLTIPCNTANTSFLCYNEFCDYVQK